MTGLSVEQVARRMPELQDSRKVEFVKDEFFNAVVVDGYRVWKLIAEKTKPAVDAAGLYPAP